MLTLTETKNCQACGRLVKGRSDKKFCDDSCRNAFNNYQNAANNGYVRHINNILRKNRRILEGFLTAEENVCKAKREKMLRLGFDFDYFTHTYTNKCGQTYHFCYEYGYLTLENELYLIVKKSTE